MSKILQIILKKIFVEKYQFRSTFFVFINFVLHQNWTTFVPKISKKLGFFWQLFWLNKTQEKIIVIFVISAFMASIWNVFIKFRWHDEKFTIVIDKLHFGKTNQTSILYYLFFSSFKVRSKPTRAWKIANLFLHVSKSHWFFPMLPKIVLTFHCWNKLF